MGRDMTRRLRGTRQRETLRQHRLPHATPSPDIVTLSVLAATGGVLTNVVIEEMVTQAHDGPTSSLGPLLLTAGFGLFALISVYITI